jgi:regulator of sigma E protease
MPKQEEWQRKSFRKENTSLIMSTSFIAFIIVLGVLIFAHEFGHFIVARLCGVGVERFSLGFGPRIIGKKVGITDYRISAIPLGGYVKMVGEEPGEEIESADIPFSFTHKSLIRRALIVAAGPVFNVLLATFIFFCLFWIVGTYSVTPTIGDVTPDSPASIGGLQKGDRVLAIDGETVDTWDQMAERIGNSKGRTLQVSVRREGEIKDFTLKPMRQASKNIFGEPIDRYIIGIASAGDVISQNMSFFQALWRSLTETWNIVDLTFTSIVKMFQGTVSTKTLGGPLMIAEMAGQQAKEGVAHLAFFTALLSINLAILNILPIPVLDGGHLFFFLLEAVLRRPVSLRVREIAQQAGIFVLILLMLLVFYNDITRMFLS